MPPPDLPIDLRSDTVTRPDRGMLDAMVGAPLGDDVFGDDPTVKRLEETAAALLGKERALFVPSGTMANSIAIAIATRPGDEALIEAGAHSLHFEVGGAARLWGVQLAPLPGERGAVPLAMIREAARPHDIHVPRTRMLILEQTANLAGGTVLPLDYLRRAGELARELGLHFHLDGARVFNAAVASGVAVKDHAAPADTVMFSISKGLGAPAGSLLAGPGGLIDEARRVRKLLGGGMRQVGILAACGLHALEHNVARLAEDHENARALAEVLIAAAIPGARIDRPETNMVYARIDGASPADYRRLVQALEREGILAVTVLGRALRLVFHKDAAGDRARWARDAVLRVLRREAPGLAGPRDGKEA